MGVSDPQLGVYSGLSSGSFYPFDYIINQDYDSSGNLIYEGWARPGFATSDARWRIRKFTYTNGYPTAVRYADGNLKFDNIWDNRASLSYS